MNCEQHQWCTYHKSAKYKKAFADLARSLEKAIPRVMVTENQLPPERPDRVETVYDHSTGETKLKHVDKRGVRGPFPRLGAFEVYFRHHLVFSKLSTSLWPNVDLLTEKLGRMVENVRAGRRADDGIKLRSFSKKRPEE